MDAVLRNFKAIPCPAGDACTQPRCQWQHSWDESASSAGAAATREDSSSSGSSSNNNSSNNSNNHNDPRKRQTLTSSVSPPPLKRKAVSPVAFVEPRPKAPKTSVTSTTPVTAPSPAQNATATPLRRPPAVQSSSPAPSAIRRSIGGSSSPAPVPSKPAAAIGAASKPTATPSRKPESLNPRHLKSNAPATHDFRCRAVNMLHEQFQRLNNQAKKEVGSDKTKSKQVLRSPQELIWLALDEEERVATDKPSIYNNIIKNRIMTYKKMRMPEWVAERVLEYEKRTEKPVTETAAKGVAASTPNEEAKAKAAVRSSKELGPQLGPPKVIQTGLTPAQEVEILRKIETPITNLAKYGYVPVIPAEADVAKAREGEEASMGYETCDRCHTRFQVFPGRREEDGALASGGKCTHHYGKAYLPAKAPGDTDRVPKRYKCCGEALGDSPGCVQGESHVFKVSSAARLASLVPFAETPPNEKVPKDRAVCFDCEMCYTVRGMELVRLTATSWPDGKVLLDVLVRPVGEILDLNSRYSGVWPDDIVNAKPYDPDAPTGSSPDPEDAETGNTGASSQRQKRRLPIASSPAAARDLLFSLISPDTPLLGHGLENDLNSVRIVHPTIVDTVLLYPHRRGLPMRYGLKMLMELHLNRRIQVDTDEDGKEVLGHDSAEDARAAGDLVRLKVSEEWDKMRRFGWTLADGVFVPPGAASKTGDGKLTEGFLEEENSRTELGGS